MARDLFRFQAWIIVAVFLAAGPLLCQAGENPELQGLVDELRTLAEKSRNERAADRWLQQALEDLVSKYDWPWRSELLIDEFSDGNFTADPAWTVLSGKFWVDASLGLRSSVRPKPQSRRSESNRERSRDSSKDVGRAIFGQLLDQAFKDDEPEESGSRPERDVSQEGPARIRLDTRITHAFSLELDFSVHHEPGVEGHFEVALLQEEAGDYGYVLAVRTGEQGMMDLYRLRRGQRELVNSSTLKGDTAIGKRHELVWRQANNGQVEVCMNGEESMNLQDRAFRDPYTCLEFVNQNGEIGVSRVRILGTPE